MRSDGGEGCDARGLVGVDFSGDRIERVELFRDSWRETQRYANPHSRERRASAGGGEVHARQRTPPRISYKRGAGSSKERTRTYGFLKSRFADLPKAREAGTHKSDGERDFSFSRSGEMGAPCGQPSLAHTLESGSCARQASRTPSEICGGGGGRGEGDRRGQLRTRIAAPIANKAKAGVPTPKSECMVVSYEHSVRDFRKGRMGGPRDRNCYNVQKNAHRLERTRDEDFGDRARTWSASLSGCPSFTDSEVKKKVAPSLEAMLELRG